MLKIKLQLRIDPFALFLKRLFTFLFFCLKTFLHFELQKI